MAETTQKTQRSLLSSSLSVDKIQRSVTSFSKSLNNTQKTTLKLNTTLISASRFKRESLANDRNTFQKRREASRRREQEDIVEASTVGGAIRRQGKAVASSTKGFLGRILDFIGTLMVGWLIQNLPIIVNLAQQLIGRIQKLVGILGGFIKSTTEVLSGFGSLLAGVFSNLISFDFTDQSGQISRALTQMESGFMGIERDFTQAYNLLTEPLDLGFGELKFPGDLQQEGGEGEPGAPGTSGSGEEAQPGSYPRGTYDVKKLTQLAKSAGMPQDKIPTMVSIALAESGGRTDALNDNPRTGDLSYGLWQINMIGRLGPDRRKRYGLKSNEELKDPATNARVAKEILLRDGGLSAWSTFKGGDYQRFLPQAQQAYNQLKSQPAAPPQPAQTTPTGPKVTTSVIDELNVAQDKSPLGGISDTFGYSSWRGRMHNGIDIGVYGQRGFYVAFKGSGTVKFSGVNGGYGNLVIIQSGNTQYYFAHLAKRMVRQGESYRGQTIGEIGTTGSSTNIHLHYEVRPGGKPVDPRPYLGYLSIGRKLTGVAGTPTGGEVRATPAQIQAATRESGQEVSAQLTTERTGQLVFMPLSESEVAPSYPESGSSSSVKTVSTPMFDETALNRMVAQKLLLDLAYT